MSYPTGMILPHQPLLLESIGKRTERGLKDMTAMVLAAQHLHASLADVLMILSPHGSLISHHFL